MKAGQRSKGRGTLASYRLLLAVAMMGICNSRASALTRYDALFTALEYNAATMDITAANQYPAVACYVPGAGARGLPKLGIGTYAGAVYSFRPGAPRSVFQILTDIDNGLGAGNSSWLLANAPTCVATHTTGIDCSQYVSAAWRVSRVTTASINSVAQRIDDGCMSCIQPGDANNWAGEHVVMFAERPFPDPGPTFGWFFSYEAWGGGRCVSRVHEYLSDLTLGYVAWVANKLKDAPFATVSHFEVVEEDGILRARWGTLMERETKAFVVWGTSAEGEVLRPLSPVLPAVGSPSVGAEYEYELPGDLAQTSIFELRELERSGRELTHGRRKPVPAVAGERK